MVENSLWSQSEIEKPMSLQPIGFNSKQHPHPFYLLLFYQMATCLDSYLTGLFQFGSDRNLGLEHYSAPGLIC